MTIKSITEEFKSVDCLRFLRKLVFPSFVGKVNDVLELYRYFQERSCSTEFHIGEHYLNISDGVFLFNGHNIEHSVNDVGNLILQDSEIKRFVLVDCILSHDVITSMIEFLLLNPSLTHIGLEKCSNVSNVIEPLLKSLHQTKSLTSFSLKGSLLEESIVLNLCEVIQTSESITFVDVTRCDLSEEALIQVNSAFLK
ncbi:hypothetical protein GEMRC1_003157 [Eukaryota sp. GEM-RC1]